MRISLVTPSFYPATAYGGPIFSTLNISKALSKIENISIFVSTTDANVDDRLVVDLKIWHKFREYFYVKYYHDTILNKFSLGLMWGLWRDIDDSDMVYTQYMFDISTPISIVYAKLLKKPILLSPRGSLCPRCLAQGSSLKGVWLDWIIRPFVRYITWQATSTQERDDILAQFKSAKVVIAPNGVDYARYQSSDKLTKQEFCKKYIHKNIDIDKIIVSMGRLHEHKGFDILIYSFKGIVSLYPNSKLFIAGADAGAKDDLLKQIERLGMNEEVFFVGELKGEEKIDFLANADLFVLSSHSENFGNVYIESLATGTPIIASKNTPWGEVVDYNCGEWIPNSILDTSIAMDRVLRKDRELMRSNSKRLAKKYDWKYIANQLQTVFDDLIKNSSNSN